MTHSAEMKLKSETAILDVMHKNDAKSSDMLQIATIFGQRVQKMCPVWW